MDTDETVPDPDVDTSGTDALAADAKSLYLAVQEMALDYERQTAGHKLAMTKAKAIQT